MLYLIIDNIAEFFGSNFRSNDHPILYILIRAIVLGLFIFLISIVYSFFKLDDFGINDIIFNFFNGLLFGFITSVLIFLWGKFVDFVDRIAHK